MGKVWKKIKPSWLSRSHESLVFNSSPFSASDNCQPPIAAAAVARTATPGPGNISNGMSTSYKYLPSHVNNANQINNHDVTRGYSPSEFLTHTHNFPPLHTSTSQYFNTHRHPKLNSSQQHPSLSLDTNDNFLFNNQPSCHQQQGELHDSSSSFSAGGVNCSAAADLSSQLNSSIQSATALAQLDSSLTTSGGAFASVIVGGGKTSVAGVLGGSNNDNYLHMNGGPNGLGPLVAAGGATTHAHAGRTNSASNLQMQQSSTLDKQKLDSTTRALRYPPSVISPSPLPQNQSAQSLNMLQQAPSRASNFGSPQTQSVANQNAVSQQQAQMTSLINVTSSQQPPMTQMMNVTSSGHQITSYAPQMPPMGGMTVPQLQYRTASSLRMHVLEMKGAPSGKKQRIYCQICVNEKELGRTTAKQKLDILFWGELFNFTQQQLRELEPMQKIVIKMFKESESKKKKKEKEKPSSDSGSKDTFLGKVELSLKDICGDWHETWYNVQDKAKSCDTDVCTLRVRAVYQSVQVLDLTFYQELLDFLKEDSLLLYQVVEDAILLKEKEDFSTSLIQVLHYCDKIDSFFADVIEYELVKEANPRMVFRGNSLATKSMEAYLKFIGSQYLKETLQDTIHEIYRKDECYEIDRQKLFPGNTVNQEKVVTEQQEKFKKLCEQIWLRIQDSLEAFPWEIRKVFCKIKERLKQNYSNDVIDNIITGSIFLRFLCPAIMTPNFFGLHSAYPPDNTVRTLKLLAKLLQALANNSLLGDKENYMVFMNDFMSKEFKNMRNFLDIISTYSPQGPSQVSFNGVSGGRVVGAAASVVKADIDVAKECAIIHRMLAKIKDSPTIKSSHMTSASSSGPSATGGMASAANCKGGRNLPNIIQTLTQYYLQCSTHYQQQPQQHAPSHSYMHQQRSYNQSSQQINFNSGGMNHQMPPFMQPQYPPYPGHANSTHPHTPSTPNVDHRGVLSVMQQQQNNVTDPQSNVHSFSALPANNKGSFDSHLSRADNQNMGGGHPYNPNDPMKIRAPAGLGVMQQQQQQQQMSSGGPGDIMHSQSNSEATYYNQPAALQLLQHSHHINSTLPRSNRMQATQPAAQMSNGKMGVPSSPAAFANSFSVPPPPNYPPPMPSGVDENYENMEVLKMINRQQQQPPHNKKSSTSSNSTVHSFTAAGDNQIIANPSEPVQVATPEQAQRVRINHTQSGSIVNLHCSTPTPSQGTQAQTPPIDKSSRRGSRQQEQGSSRHTKSRLGVSSLGAGGFGNSGNAGSGKGSTPSTGGGKGAGGIYDAADQHYIMCQPTVSGEPFKACTRSATRTPTSEVNVTSQSMSVQYANSDAVNEEMMKRNSKEDILFNTQPNANSSAPDVNAKSPTSVPVQIIPETRGLRSHTPTSGGNMERQSSSHGDFMTLANPIYDVYNAATGTTDSAGIGQTPIQRMVSPTAALRRSESASSDGAMSDLSEVGSNLHRVQSDSSFPPSSFPSELDLPTSSPHSHVTEQTSPSSKDQPSDMSHGTHSGNNHHHRDHNHHHRRHNHKNHRRRYSAESSNNNQSESKTSTSAGPDKHSTHHAERSKHSRSKSRSKQNDNSTPSQPKTSDRSFRAETPEDLKFNDSLDNVFVPQSTTDCVMPSMSFKQHRNNSQSASAPVAPKEDDEEEEQAGMSQSSHQGGGADSTSVSWAGSSGGDNSSKDSHSSSMQQHNDVPEDPIAERRSSSSQDLPPSGYKEKARRGDSLTGDSSTNEPSIGSGGRSAFSAARGEASEAAVAARKRLSLHTSGSRSPALKAASVYESELTQLKNQLAERDEEMRKMRQEWEDKMNKMSDQMKKQNEAKDEHIARLAQSQEEDRKQLDSLLHEFSERDVLLNKKDEKIKILYQNNRKLLECCHKLKQKMQSQNQDVSLDISNPEDGSTNKQPLEESGESLSNSASFVANGTGTVTNTTTSSASKTSINSDVTAEQVSLSSNQSSLSSSANGMQLPQQRRVAVTNEGRNSPIRQMSSGAPPRSISSSGLSAVASGLDPNSNSCAASSTSANAPPTAIDLIKMTKTLPLELQNSTPL